MTTIVSVKVDGKVVKRCDKRCYEGKCHGEACTCICCGLLHGLGQVEASNKALDCREYITNCAKKTCGENAQVIIKVKARQLELFKVM